MERPSKKQKMSHSTDWLKQWQDNIVFKVTRHNEEAYATGRIPIFAPLCTIPAALLEYNEHNLATKAQALGRDGVVILHCTTIDQLSRFCTSLEHGAGQGHQFEKFEQFLDAFALAMDLHDKAFQNILIQELYTGLSVSERLVPYNLKTEKQFVQVVNALSAMFDNGMWDTVTNSSAPPWVNLFIEAIAKALISCVQPADINLRAYSKLVSALSTKKWHGKFCELLALRFEALQKYNLGKSGIEMEPVDKFLVKQT